MPKVRTDRGAAKRFRVTGRGRIFRQRASRSHLLEKKPSTRTRRLGRLAEVEGGYARQVRRLLSR
jgi:large subunit ribosomal protein L35